MSGPPSTMILTEYLNYIVYSRVKNVWQYTKHHNQIMKAIGKAIKAGGYVEYTENRDRWGIVRATANVYTPR